MLDTTGCANGVLIETYTGRLVDVQDLLNADIQLATIAHSLSLQCRFNGHCRQFISVAEHCCTVADDVESKLASTLSRKKRNRLCFAALMHDGSEAYLSDIPRPLKLLFRDYVELEEKVQRRIMDRFGITLTPYEHSIIKDSDNAALKAEAQLLMSSRAENWGGMNDIAPARISSVRWSPEQAESEFLRRASLWM